MKFAVAAALLLLLAACASDETAELPPFSIGGKGISAMTDARTPSERYEEAYSWLTKLHLNVRRSLETSPTNAFSASADLREIIEKLRTMQSLTAEPAVAALESYIARYVRILEAVEAGRGSGALVSDLNRWEQEIRTKYHLSEVQIVPPAAREPGTVPGVKTPGEDRLPTPPGGEDPSKPGEAPASGAPFWVLYKAWEQVHADLAAAYRAKTECVGHCNRAVDLVQRMAAATPEEQRGTLQICGKAYEAVHTKTKGFTSLPQGLTVENILAELEMISNTVRANFNPDKK